MKNSELTVLCGVALLALTGCASTKISDRQTMAANEKLPRPAHVWVYDFAATPADLPADSPLAAQASEIATPQTPEQIEMGRQLGAEIASHLVEEIRAMGMPGYQAPAGTITSVNDIVIRGYLLSVNEGSTAKRVGLGIGAGSSELKTAVEGFQVTANGLRKLGSGDLDASGNKTPGTAVGLATFLATHNPAGLIVSSGMKVYEEESGKGKVEGRADQTAKEIADQLKKRFEEQGWI